MAFQAFRNMHPLSQFFFSAFIILASVLAFMLLALIVAIPFFGTDSLTKLAQVNDLTNSDTLMMLKYLQTAQAFGLFIIPPFVLGYLFGGRTTQYLFLNKIPHSATLFLVVILMIASAPSISFLGEMNSRINLPEWLSGLEQWMREAEENAAQLTEAFLNVKSYSGLAFNLFMIALLPALGEELLFRGILQRIFVRMTRSMHWGIWISAILFSAMHLQFYGFVPRALLGALFGYLLTWSGSMWLPIMAHFTNNAVAVIASFYIHKGSLDPDVENMGGTSDSYYLAAISLLITFVLLIQIKRQCKNSPIQLQQLTN